ncbi:MAG: YfiR family protein [Verrucomicrobia bacterium]|nr:YfiR family protein [Verrucomicrobiota bacterium]
MAFLTTRPTSTGASKQVQPASPDRRRFLRGLFAFSILYAAAPGQLQAQDPSYRIKAVFLYNFAQFVTWPESAFAGPESPFVIGVLGRDPFGRILDDTVRNEVVNRRKLEVRRYRSVGEVRECQILFISPSEQAQMLRVLNALEEKPILTVAETEFFTRNGGMIRFVTEQNKIRFRINSEAAERAGLTISSKLLRLAEIVRTERSRR